MSPFGKRPPVPELNNIEPLGGPPKRPPKEAAPAGDEPDGDDDLTPEMLDYSGPEEQCGKCKHFTAPSTCDRWKDPVEETGHCEGFQAGGEGEGADDEADQGVTGDEY